MKKGPGRQVRIIILVFLAVVLFASFPFGRFSSKNIVQERLFSQKYAYSQFLSFCPNSASIKDLPQPGAFNLTGNITIDGDAALDAFCAGNGTDGLTPASAYIIQNLNFSTNGSEYGIVIQDTTRFLTIRNCTLTDVSYRGIYLNNVTNVLITCCNIAGKVTEDLPLIFPDNLAACIKCYNVTMVNVTNCILSYGEESGITLMNSTYNFVSGNYFIGNQVGIYVILDSLSNTIIGNAINGLGYEGNYGGIEIRDNSTGNVASNNSIFNVYGQGIYVFDSAGIVASGNNVSRNIAEYDNDEGAIEIFGGDDCSVTANIVDDNSENGILIESSNNCIVSNNTVLRNKLDTVGDGVYLINSNYCSISDNNVSGNNGYGIELENSNFNTVTQNFLISNAKGCASVEFYDNTFGGTNFYWLGYLAGIWNWNLIYNNVGCWIVIIPGEAIWILAGIIFSLAIVKVALKRRRVLFNSTIRRYSRKTGIPEEIFQKELILQGFFRNLYSENWKKIWQAVANTKNLINFIGYFDQIFHWGSLSILLTKSEKLIINKNEDGTFHPRMEDLQTIPSLSIDPSDPAFFKIYGRFLNKFKRFYERDYILNPMAEFRKYSNLIQTGQLNLFFKTDEGRVKRLFAQFPKVEFRQSGYFFLQVNDLTSVKIVYEENLYICEFFKEKLPPLGLQLIEPMLSRYAPKGHISFNLIDGSIVEKKPENAQKFLAEIFEDLKTSLLKVYVRSQVF